MRHTKILIEDGVPEGLAFNRTMCFCSFCFAIAIYLSILFPVSVYWNELVSIKTFSNSTHPPTAPPPPP